MRFSLYFCPVAYNMTPEIWAYNNSHDQSTLATNPAQDSIYIIVAHAQVPTWLGSELLNW